jgi:hypothetical protein
MQSSASPTELWRVMSSVRADGGLRGEGNHFQHVLQICWVKT